MKSRISTTIWTLIILNGVALFAVLGLAFTPVAKPPQLLPPFDAYRAHHPGRRGAWP